MVGDVRGQRVCDLACGQGDLARRVAARGAKVIGVDLSIGLLEIARSEEEACPLGIQYLQADAQDLPTLPDEPFDGVGCSLALMDIPDLAKTFDGVRRILRPGGWFVAAITHPCFQIPPVRSYHDEGFWRSDNPDGVRGKVGAHHRTLGTYLSALGAAGLPIERVTEPRLPGRDVPPILVLRCRSLG